MPKLAAAKALDLGVVPTGPYLGAEPPVLVSEWSVSLCLSRSIRLSGNWAHLISHSAGQCEHLLQGRDAGRVRRSSACPWGTITHSEHGL